MWTIVRFALREGRDYRAAFELLALLGFRPHQAPAPHPGAPFPAAAVLDLLQDPAAITRAVFGALDEAGLRPVAVSACHVDVARAPRRRPSLACA